MNVEQAYNSWAAQYDTNKNRTRDLEAVGLRATLADVLFEACLEIGCGTGKNTEWLVRKAMHVTAVDLSSEMLERARKKVSSNKVVFQQADITQPWQFATQVYDLVTFSLVLEHILKLDFIFEQTAAALKPGGYVYIGELHPFKQYTGTRARFGTDEGRQEVACYTHHISEFTQIAKKHGLKLIDLNEYFDDGDRTGIPRILTLLLQKV
ncbi:bifunctional 2-polyprenyl-6-hydroxyphenol methylase/3-demethylubiquinol 3-O-methyltransferase UbiG [Pontibacter sp. BAB1700]|uniref:class I SAM-dependent methyltransferase n=1 Tax=Pontibacter sp. BAB1700 TaxID=1144253 RepID=UPI00026BD5DC|nr:class I SAM-dependent methyltransferase [Pontibacter sp. BAB1700]EJF10486.1 type 11 methyltransferase [Pontibacter sp. BAB1700]